jgi:hypothetical protein
MILNHTLNRWVVYPTSGSAACLGLSMAPGSPGKLEEAVKVMKRNLQDTTIHVCAVKLTKGGKFTALEVPMWPTPASQGLSLFKGWGIRKELFTFLNRCKGDNNVPNIASYYEEEAADWPGTERRALN